MKQAKIKILQKGESGYSPFEETAITHVVIGFCTDAFLPYWTYDGTTGVMVVDIPDEVTCCADFTVILSTLFGEARYKACMPQKCFKDQIIDLGEIIIVGSGSDFDAIDDGAPDAAHPTTFDCLGPSNSNPPIIIRASLV